AHRHATDAKKSALLGGLGNVLADLAQPALEGRCIAGRLCIHHCASLPQSLDALGFDLIWLAACELLLEAVARRASPSGSLEVGDDCFDQRVRPGAHFGLHHPAASRRDRLQRAQEAAGLGSRDGDPRRHHALQKKLPFVGGEARLVRHGLTPLLKFWSALLRLLLHQPLASYRRSTKSRLGNVRRSALRVSPAGRRSSASTARPSRGSPAPFRITCRAMASAGSTFQRGPSLAPVTTARPGCRLCRTAP